MEVGAAYKLAFQTYVGTAFGGIPFSDNPAVAVVDRGGNTVPTADYALYGDDASYQIQAVLSACPFADIAASPAAMQALLQPAALTVAPLSQGIATFEGLYMNRSGYPYQITFYSDLVRYCELGFDSGCISRIQFAVTTEINSNSFLRFFCNLIENVLIVLLTFAA